MSGAEGDAGGGGSAGGNPCHGPPPADILPREEIQPRIASAAGKRVRMRTIFIRAAALAACCVAAFAGPLASQAGAERSREGGFELFITHAYGDGEGSALTAGVAIPYRRLVFFLRNGRYEARYRVYLELFDERGRRVRGEVWEESVEASGFRETTSSASLARSSRRFPVAPGTYRASATVEVIGTSRRFIRVETARIVGAAAGRLELSNPSFWAVPAPDGAPPPAVRFSRCPAGEAATGEAVQGSVFGRVGDAARVAYDIFVPEGEAGRRVLFSTRVRGASGAVVQYHRAVLEELQPGPEALCLELAVDDWPIGFYTIESVVEAPAARLRDESGGRFLVLLNGGLFGAHVADCEVLLSLVAGAEEARGIVGAPPGERFRAWSAFWKRRDPTPATAANEAFEEFLERLRHVLENFSGTRPGFRTDRGRIYIENGPPDRVESRSDPGARSYEFWFYTAQSVVYVFEDVIGSGDFKLIATRLL